MSEKKKQNKYMLLVMYVKPNQGLQELETKFEKNHFTESTGLYSALHKCVKFRLMLFD